MGLFADRLYTCLPIASILLAALHRCLEVAQVVHSQHTRFWGLLGRFDGCLECIRLLDRVSVYSVWTGIVRQVDKTIG